MKHPTSKSQAISSAPFHGQSAGNKVHPRWLTVTNMPPIQQQWKRSRWLLDSRYQSKIPHLLGLSLCIEVGTNGCPGLSLNPMQKKKKMVQSSQDQGEWTWAQLAWCFLKSTELDQGTVLCLWAHLWPYMTLSPSPMNFPVLIVPQGGCLVGGCDIRTPREFTTPEIFKLILLPSSYVCKHEL